jgi:hypothetical protein
MADRIARVWNGSAWEVITSTTAAPNAVVAYQSSAPSSPVTGQLWIDSDNNVLYVWDGVNWDISGSDLSSYAPLSSPTFTGTVTIPTLNITTKLITEETMTIALSDEATNITTGTAKVTMRAPFAMTLTQIPRSSLTTVSTSGLVTVDINEGGTSVLGANKLSIDANEKTSTTAATATTIADASIADDAEITFDIDAAGTGAKGLKITLYFKRT